MHELVHPRGGGPPGSIDIGRPTKWGNPFPLERAASDHDRRLVVLSYAAWLFAEEQLVSDARAQLVGMHLECPGRCAPRLCHGDVLARVAAGATYTEIVRDLELTRS